MKLVEIYTDGACSGNPGPGGWAALLRCDGETKEISGAEAASTNQRMELQAAIMALRSLKYQCQVKLYSDSAYLINAFRQDWIGNWLANGWRNAKRQAVENQDLWQELIRLDRMHQIEWLKVAGHQQDQYNNRCDELARAAVKQLPIG